MKMTVTTPASSGSGQLQFTQLVATCYVVLVPPPGTSQYYGTYPSTGSASPYWLDTSAPYDGALGVLSAPGGTATTMPTAVTQDSPGYKLTSSYTAGDSFAVYDSFVDYYQYRPPGSNTIWVTFYEFGWSWRAVTNYNNAPNNWSMPENVTQFPSNPNGSAFAVGQPYYLEPLWTYIAGPGILSEASPCALPPPPMLGKKR